MKTTDLLVLAVVLLILSPAAHATVESTCKAISSGGSGSNFDFCVKTLQSDPASATADLRGHAVIATKLSSNKAAEVFAKIQTLLQSSQEKDERMCLSTCSELYDLLISDLDKAGNAIKERRKDDAITALSASLDAPGNCEMAFEELSVTSLLAAEDNEQAQLCGLALQIGSLAFS